MTTRLDCFPGSLDVVGWFTDRGFTVETVVYPQQSADPLRVDIVEDVTADLFNDFRQELHAAGGKPTGYDFI